jgi:hypothetical protein
MPESRSAEFFRGLEKFQRRLSAADCLGRCNRNSPIAPTLRTGAICTAVPLATPMEPEICEQVDDKFTGIMPINFHGSERE